jgi:DNA-binding MarR family transcriptional regulator
MVRPNKTVGSTTPGDSKPHDQHLEPLDSRAVFLLSQIGHHIAAAFAERLEPFKVQPRHFAVMNGLAAADGSTQQRLADTLGIHRNVMVGLVDDLERLGYAKRAPHPDDRRAHAVRLTADGRRVLTSAHIAAATLESDVTKFLPTTERAKFIQQLQRLAAGVGLEAGSHPSLREMQ